MKLPARQLKTGAPVAVGDANSAGTSDATVLSDHVHAHGTHTDPLNHAEASTTAAGFLSASDKQKLASVESGAQVVTTARVVSALAVASSDVSINLQKLTNVADPTLPQDACNKAYVDAAAQGLDTKASVRAVATSPITTGGAPVSIDGVSVQAGERALLTAQSNAKDNGIYVVATGTWARAIDASTSAKVTSGMYTYASEGATYAASGWVLITPDPIVLNTTGLTFTQFSGAGQIVAGRGMTKSGNTLDVNANADGSIVVSADDVKVGVLATDAQHGLRGGGNTVHPDATTSVSGFFTAVEKIKLAGVATGATAVPYSSTTPSSLGTASVGTPATGAALGDHVHPHGPIAIGDGSYHGVATQTIAGFQSASDKLKLDGLANTPLSAVTPQPLGTAAVGNGTTAARDNHVHAHGALTDPTLHALASGSAHGFMSSGDYTRLSGVAANATNTPLASTNPADIGAAAPGSSGTAARSDHVHAHGTQAGGMLHALADGTNPGFMSSAHYTRVQGVADSATNTPFSSTTPSALGTAAVGTTATGAARGDHVHAHGAILIGDGSYHAIATQSIAGFLSSTDKAKIDNSVTYTVGNGLQAPSNVLAVKPADSSIIVASGGISVGAIAAAQHGIQTDGTLHADAVADGADGFMTGLQAGIVSRLPVITTSTTQIRSVLPVNPTGAKPTSGTVCALYIGQMQSQQAIKYISFYVTAAGTANAATTANAFICSSPAGPVYNTPPTLTIVALSQLDSLTTTGVKKQITTPFYTCPKGMHLWVALRFATTTIPTVLCSYGDNLSCLAVTFTMAIYNAAVGVTMGTGAAAASLAQVPDISVAF